MNLWRMSKLEFDSSASRFCQFCATARPVPPLPPMELALSMECYRYKLRPRRCRVQPPARADGQSVVVGEGHRVLIVIEHAAERSGRGAAGGIDDIQARALGAVVTDVEHDAAGDGALEIQVPDLHVGQPVVLVDRVVALGLAARGSPWPE